MIHGLLAATCSLLSGVAAVTTRSTDITCGGQFPKAGDGFAQRPDGCSSWSDNPNQVADKWGSANFGGVCDEHDRCYYTIGANVDICNDNFCRGLRDACHRAYCKELLFGATFCEPVTYGSCTVIADTYCAAVKATAAGIYEKAQDLQKAYETCIAENGGIAPPPPPVLCSNGKPEGTTWTERLDGSRCTTTTYVCRNGKIIVTNSFHAPHCIEP
jgi:hypothetical protein